MEQICKYIEEVQDYYYITEKGEVLSFARSNPISLSLSRDKDGYYRVSLQTKDNRRKSYRVNRLVALSFIPNPMNYPIVNHINHNIGDNSVDNLEWCSISYNTKDGYNHNNYHFTKAIVVIKDGEIVGKFSSIMECATFYDVTYFDISKVANNRKRPATRGKLAGLEFQFA